MELEWDCFGDLGLDVRIIETDFTIVPCEDVTL